MICKGSPQIFMIRRRPPHQILKKFGEATLVLNCSLPLKTKILYAFVIPRAHQYPFDGHG